MSSVQIFIISLIFGGILSFPSFPFPDARNGNIVIEENYRGSNGLKEDINDELKGGVKVHEQIGPYQAEINLDDE